MTCPGWTFIPRGESITTSSADAENKEYPKLLIRKPEEMVRERKSFNQYQSVTSRINHLIAIGSQHVLLT
jgi:hypothetical protein